jgi:hypothetical protein
MNGCEETVHDQVVAARAAQLRVLFRVLADPHITKNSPVSGLYPDIIVIDDEKKIIYIEKVETESTVTEDSRNEQWRRYAQLRYPFNLIVPDSQIIKAEHLIKGINVHTLLCYKLTPLGIRFFRTLI